jgi:FAD/FMN-containing dehydrogenase
MNSESNLKRIINIIKKSKFRPYLTVVKMMGHCNSNYLSFPIKGYSFALDFKNEIDVIKLFDKLDKIIIKMNGRIYLAKDSSIKKDNFFKMYPKVNDFKKILSKYSPSGKITSLQSLRLGIS